MCAEITLAALGHGVHDCFLNKKKSLVLRSVVLLPRTFVKELLTRDLVALDRVDADLFHRDPLAGGFRSDFEGEMDRKLVGAVEERTADLFAADGTLGLKAFGLLDDRCLAGSFLAAGFDGNDVGSIH